jgi:hypothetical protein
MVQFLSTLQEALRVFSNAISRACTAQSWEMFCCSFGRIIGINVYTDLSVTLHFIVSHFITLLMANLMARYSILSG